MSGDVIFEVEPGYEALADVLKRALDQAQHGKGRERHGDTTSSILGRPASFIEQPICRLAEVYGLGYQLGQSAKKAHEALHLPSDRAKAELLGAIVYLCAAHIHVEERERGGGT